MSPGSAAVVLEKLNGAVSVSAKEQRGRKSFEQRRYLQRSCETNSRSPDVNSARKPSLSVTARLCLTFGRAFATKERKVLRGSENAICYLGHFPGERSSSLRRDRGLRDDRTFRRREPH